MKNITGLGMNVYLNHYDKESFHKLIETILLLKVSWIRLELCSYKFNDVKTIKKLHEFILMCKEKNILVVGLLADFIPLNTLNVFFPELRQKAVSSRIDSYLGFIDNLLTYLSKDIYIWEIWNEQNTKRFWVKSPSAKEYVFFAKQIACHIKLKQKDARFIFGGVFGNDVDKVYGFIPNSIIAEEKYIHRAINYGASKYLDYYAFHPYTRECFISVSSAEEIACSIINSIKKTLKYYKAIPLIITEIGVSPILNFRINAFFIAKIYKEVINFCNEKSIPVCIYALSDQSDIHYGRLNPDRNFGFLDYHLNAKDLLKEFKKIL